MDYNNPYQKAGFASFDQLYTAHSKGVRNFINCRIRKPDIAEDLAQETFMQVLESIERYDQKKVV
ncbi:MAG TPA: sigma factor [Candidatus Nanoarchaeia archaeon]|nr:sigma factor [Candidatus Nanoarchaeia archaeon]